MEFLRKLMLQTQEQLKGLTLSQRLAIGSCAALIMVALLWLANWAGSPEMGPLMSPPMSSEQMSSIPPALDGMNVAYKVTGDTILVPVSERYRLLANLEQQKLLTGDISLGFNNLMESSNPFLSQDELNFRRSVARANELSAVLRNFDGISDAKVFIDEKTRRMVGAPSVTPTASVWVKPSFSGEMSKELVHALASFVSRSVAGLDITRVAVTDSITGRSYSVESAEDRFAFDDLENRQKNEEYYASKIRRLLHDIPGVKVAVQAQLSAESIRQRESKFEKPVILSESSESSKTASAPPANGPGVNPNVSVSLAESGGGSQSETKSTKTEFAGQPSSSDTYKEKPRHVLEGLSAAIIVPRSYLAGIFAKANEGAEPTDAELEQAMRNTELAKIEQLVQRALDINPEQVRVDWFHDNAGFGFGEGGAHGVMAAASGGGDMMGYVKSYGGRAGLALLAVMSMAMMLMMVRKVGEGPVLPGEEPPSKRRKKNMDDEVETLPVDGQPVGEASLTEQTLEGLEVDPAVLKVQHMIEQIGDMIQEDTEGSVSILERWVQQDQT